MYCATACAAWIAAEPQTSRTIPEASSCAQCLTSVKLGLHHFKYGMHSGSSAPARPLQFQSMLLAQLEAVSPIAPRRHTVTAA